MVATIAQRITFRRASSGPLPVEPRVTLGLKPPVMMRVEGRS